VAFAARDTLVVERARRPAPLDEVQARATIDGLLPRADRRTQDKADADPPAGRGGALREVTLATGTPTMPSGPAGSPSAPSRRAGADTPRRPARHLVAELAAGAATHSRVPCRDFRLALDAVARTLRAGMTDTRGEALPEPQTPACDSASGRGLLPAEATGRPPGCHPGPASPEDGPGGAEPGSGTRPRGLRRPGRPPKESREGKTPPNPAPSSRPRRHALIRRRNKIAHDTDLIDGGLGERRPVDRAAVTDADDRGERIALAVAHVPGDGRTDHRACDGGSRPPRRVST